MQDKYGRTALHLIADPLLKKEEALEIAEMLLSERGINPNLPDTLNGATPLHYAALYGYEEVGILLLTCGADVRSVTRDGRSPLHCAVASGFLQLTERLLARGADIEAQNASGATPLHIAAMWGRIELAKLLLNEGAKVDAKDHLGHPPLYYARKNKKMVELLRKYLHQ